MTDKFTLTPLPKLLKIVLNQIENSNSIFGLQSELFFRPTESDSFRAKRFGRILESPIGVAAGPHTQLAQNIIMSWLAGASYIELKTVQTLDEIEVSKPCIDIQDEGYNCEWSQELKLEESFHEYLNALIIIHILKDKLSLGSPKYDGFIFNMSAGYDLAGIKKDNVQWFLDKMMDASVELKQKIEEIKDIYPNVVNLNINPVIADNITLSTMHGCPPDEIEAIAEYLLTEKKLHTTVKLNPTLLGKEELNQIIGSSGFSTVVPDEAFNHDPKFNDVVSLIEKLTKIAEKENLFFGIKLTNTLESINNKNVFPENEKMMYASGKVLHPISINVAKKLQNHFKGSLDVSFSGGADAFNVKEVLSCGLYPVTVSSDLLKPGGYGRLQQYLENLEGEKVLTDSSLALENLNKYADFVKTSHRYKKETFANPSIKTSKQLTQFDCAFAPCEETCPTNQGIPSYMYYTAKGEFEKAYEVIADTNPFANTTGMVCDHVCQTKCTRINYDSSLLIRDIKRFVVETHNKNINPEACVADSFSEIADKGLNVAIVGAGPSGLSCAYFLRKAGFEVEVFEEKSKAGGMVSGAIPKFRLTNESIDIDVNNIVDLGVKVFYNQKVDKTKFEKLKKDYTYIFIAAGAQKFRQIFEKGTNIIFRPTPLDFFNSVEGWKLLNKINFKTNHVAVVGGGNTAMDVARTAKRLVGDAGTVSIIYRRTIKEMPADFEEIQAAIDEGITFLELTHPIGLIQKFGELDIVKLIKMQLGEKDESGRRSPVEIKGSEFEMNFDMIVDAIGQDIDIDFASKNEIKTKDDKYETSLENVFIGGDALRGASSIINAVGDGRKTAQEIIEKAGISYNTKTAENREENDVDDLMLKKTKRVEGIKPKETSFDKRNNFDLISISLTKEEAQKEAERCLLCDEVCNICTTLCPNLALQAYEVETGTFQLQTVSDGKIIDAEIFEIKQSQQILHIADWCNECANCETFCPTSGAPYKEKPHLYLDKNYFEQQRDGYYFDSENNTLLAKESGFDFSLTENDEFYNYKSDNFTAKLNKSDLKIVGYTGVENESLKKAAEMAVIFEGAVNFSS